MKKTSRRKTCIGIAAIISFVGLIVITIGAILALFVLRSCVAFLDNVTSSWDIQSTGVGFFESTGGWDYRRIALIEPYQAVSVDKEMWGVDLKTDSFRYQTSVRATKLDVIDTRFIVTYSSNTTLEGKWVDELWFVIIPEESIEVGFTEEEKFLTYLKDNGIDNPNLTDVNELYEELINKGYLEWFPEKYKE